MREIREVIFRGKRADNGEWIEGSLLGIDWCDKPSTYSIAPNTPVSVFYSVIPETVGQFTGLTDKNGKRIFEGDILKSTIKIIDYADVGFSISHYDEEDIGIVEWRKDGFMIAHKSGTWARSFYGSENYVIGNMHDNPDILKGGGDNG